jgi:hypothetical protein
MKCSALRHLVLALCSCFLICVVTHAQQVIDATTGAPVPYASIQVVGSENRGASAAEDGTFRLDVADSTMIRVSCVGFKPQTIRFTGASTLVLLERVSSELQEVVITPDESEAARVIRRCVENRKYTAPTQYEFFQCILYNKYRADLLRDSTGNLTKVQRMLEKTLEGESIFFSESAMTYFYERPGKTYEEIVANHVVGFKTPDFNFLPEQFVAFDLNTDFIDLLNRDYLSPLSKGSERSYVLHLEEMHIDGADTSWHILFWPQSSQYDMLRGNVVITSDRYALEELRFTNDKRDAVRFDIYHHFRKWHGKWFPDQMFSNIIMADIGLGIDVLYEQKTYIDSVRFERIPIATKNANRIAFAERGKYDPTKIERSRVEPLTSDDSIAIGSVQATADKVNIEGKADLISNLSFGRIPVGPVDIDLYRTLYGNGSEGWRLGTGLVTNKRFSRHVTLDAYYGWGVEDHLSKYGGGISVNLNPEETVKAYIRYDREVVPVASYQIRDISSAIFAAYYSDAFEDAISYTFGLKGRFSNWVYNPYFQKRETTPRFPYLYQKEVDLTLSQFKYSIFGLNINYLQRKYLPYYDYDVVVSDVMSPYFEIEMSLLTKNVWGSNVQAFRTQVFYKQPIKLRRLGDVEIAVHAGSVWGDTPIDLLHVGNGTDTRGIPYETKYAFNTMAPFTYFAGHYINLFYRHKLIRLYLSKYSAPRVSVHQHSGWGYLRQKQDHLEIEAKDYRYGYHESGLGFEDILRYNVFSLLHIGINASAWYRWGPYTGPQFSDNFAWKVGLNLGF